MRISPRAAGKSAGVPRRVAGSVFSAVYPPAYWVIAEHALSPLIT
jgi:hypothetical protein